MNCTIFIIVNMYIQEIFPQMQEIFYGSASAEIISCTVFMIIIIHILGLDFLDVVFTLHGKYRSSLVPGLGVRLVQKHTVLVLQVSKPVTLHIYIIRTQSGADRKHFSFKRKLILHLCLHVPLSFPPIEKLCTKHISYH